MIELDNNRLIFRFPEVHAEARCEIDFQRTLRIPDDNREYPLPPGLGAFPMHHVDDFAERLPAAWHARGGVFLPMYQAEALWIDFSSDYPCAVKIAAGKINAVTGEAWQEGLNDDPQDYVVIPTQPWLDGFCVDRGRIRQFVAMPLGEGYSVEEQLTGTAEHGGLQLAVYPMKADVYEKYKKEKAEEVPVLFCESASADYDDMGLAPGGVMRQEIYDDPHGLNAWDQATRSRCFVHLANSAVYREITGARPPHEPPTAQQYTQAGLPWFDYYDVDQKALDGAPALAAAQSVAAKTIGKGEGPMTDNEPVEPSNVRTLGPAAGVVREGGF